MTVKEITLLSIEEYVKYKPIIPRIEKWWWLRSPGTFLDNATLVYHDGYMNAHGYAVDSGVIAVRPALKLELVSSDLQFWYKPEKLIGTKIKYGKYTWTVLDMNLGELYALCDEFIATHRFDPESNNWDKSELKQWLETEGIGLITN